MDISTIAGIIIGGIGIGITVYFGYNSVFRHKPKKQTDKLDSSNKAYVHEIGDMFAGPGSNEEISETGTNAFDKELPESITVQGLSILIPRNDSIESRLSNLENTLNTLKNRKPDLSSQEYQLLIFELQRVSQELKEDIREKYNVILEKQNSHENTLNSRIETYKTIFMVSLTIVGLLITALSLVVIFLPKG
jgi:hypothetical protein